MKRLTILSLMGLVLAVAIAIAALRNADDYWAGGMVLATPLLVGVILIAAPCGEDRSRPRRLGFAILGGGYFALRSWGSPSRTWPGCRPLSSWPTSLSRSLRRRWSRSPSRP